MLVVGKEGKGAGFGSPPFFMLDSPGCPARSAGARARLPGSVARRRAAQSQGARLTFPIEKVQLSYDKKSRNI